MLLIISYTIYCSFKDTTHRCDHKIIRQDCIRSQFLWHINTSKIAVMKQIFPIDAKPKLVSVDESLSQYETIWKTDDGGQQEQPVNWTGKLWIKQVRNTWYYTRANKKKHTHVLITPNWLSHKERINWMLVSNVGKYGERRVGAIYHEKSKLKFNEMIHHHISKPVNRWWYTLFLMHRTSSNAHYNNVHISVSFNQLSN
jgi:hypothetical protein